MSDMQVRMQKVLDAKQEAGQQRLDLLSKMEPLKEAVRTGEAARQELNSLKKDLADIDKKLQLANSIIRNHSVFEYEQRELIERRFSEVVAEVVGKDKLGEIWKEARRRAYAELGM